MEVPVSAVRTITATQARYIHAQEQCHPPPPAQGVAGVSAATEGSLLPIVDPAPPETGAAGGERRKPRQVRGQEARLSVAPAPGSLPPRFAAPFGAPATVGEQRRDCALRVGVGPTSRGQSGGDGAPGIAAPGPQVFGPPGR